MTELRVEPLTIPGARLGDENPLPFFRDPAVSMPVRAAGSLPAEKRHLLGWETAFRVLPYRMQDQYTRDREPLVFRSIVLENEYLKATFLPEMGGRLISLFYKPLQRELLHRNPVFQPANLAIRNAWFSGGIEWNIGQFGHTFTTCAPLFAGVIQGAQGEPGLRLYEFERCKRLFWQIDFTLPPGFPFLVAYTRVLNPNPSDISMYWWTNIAVNEAPGVRVLAPAAQAIYMDVEKSGHAFGCTDLPGLPSLKGADGTYALNSTFANEFFFQCDRADLPWEAALDPQGQGFIEASTGFLKYRKLFCWGSHAGGRHWQEFLSQPGEAYLEIQAGLAPTQVHGLVMPANSAWDWTQVFGFIEADPKLVHSPDWPAAWKTVDAALKASISPEQISTLEQASRARADLPAGEILQHGSGWGALELRRRAAQPGDVSVPASFVFPGHTLGPEQDRWLALLEHGALPEQDPARLPGEWMVQPEWRAMLENSLREHSLTWYALLHLGVMRLEAFDEAGAASAWEQSILLRPSMWAYRNLAILRLRQKDEAAALEYYRQAWQLAVASSALPGALAVEYLQLLVATRQYALGMEVYASLPAQARDADRVQILRGQIAMQLGNLDAVEQVLQRNYAVVREGEITLSDLWFELHARRLSAQTGEPLTQALRQKVRAELKPPARIDFRSFNEI
jgi:hypothetical protein